MINMTPQEIIAKFKYESVTPFENGVAIATKRDFWNSPPYCFHIGENGEPLYDTKDPRLRFDELGFFKDDWARFRKFAGWGFVNPQGQILKDPDENPDDHWGWRNRQFMQVSEFKDGEAEVSNVHGYVFTIGTDGRLKRKIKTGNDRNLDFSIHDIF